MAEAWVTGNQTGEWYDIPLVLGFDTQSEVPNVLHRIIGRGDPDVTLKDPGLRSGTFEFWFEDYDTAYGVFWMHQNNRTFRIDLAIFWTSIPYVVNGALSLRQEPGTQRWVVSVPYAEVP